MPRTAKARPSDTPAQAKRPAGPSKAASPNTKGQASKPGYKTCEPCPMPDTCGFEEKCNDRVKHAGRPSLFSQAIADEIVNALLDGVTVKRWCEADPTRPTRMTVFNWTRERPDFFTSLARAREEGFTEALIDDVLDIADSGENDTYTDSNGNKRVDTDVVQRSKLRVEARFRLAEKINPARYGQKIDMTVKDERLTIAEVDAKLATVIARAAGIDDAATRH